MSKIDRIKERLNKVPLTWNINQHLATFSLHHIDSNPADEYWKAHEDHLDFMRNAPTDIDYLLTRLEIAQDEIAEFRKRLDKS